ncbi:MAG: DUF4910 domain-containing protein [Ignavibacteriae bacterium]|nr:DUF4910 domain-containing protein [Ignavibacteriota bacterium]
MQESELQSVDNEIYSLVEELFPICRSITGDGVKQTLEIISQRIPLKTFNISSGTKVFDWTVPKEWNIKDAYIKNSKGERIVDFKKSNLYVASYSQPINKKLNLSELKKHIHTLPEKPDWIPYRTLYYQDDWNFCMTDKELQKMEEDTYHAVIDSQFTNGNLTYGEFFLEGEVKDEVLISTHICHPSMCNDNLSGISVVTQLAQYLQQEKRKYSYRFIFVPATIGAITWLSQNEDNLSNIKYGLVAALLGDSSNFNYKKSRNGNSQIDKICEYILSKSEKEYEIHEFTPYGYDERQFCSPGINLEVGRLTRAQNGAFEEYHTSADNLDFVRPEFLDESFQIYSSIIDVIENNKKFVNLSPKCEPQLGKRGLYKSIAGNVQEKELAMLWILNYSDGENDLLDIAIKSNINFNILVETSTILLNHKLLKEV